MSWEAPRDAGSIPVRLQVIDVESRSLDVVIPSWMPAGDLTQRLARDASLDAYWDDGTRRRYWLRARGRILQDNEKLDDIGVVPFELIHLLPEPPKGSQVIERLPDYPKTRGYAAAGFVNIAMGILTIFAWTSAWAVALTVDQRPAIGLLPGVALGLITIVHVLLVLLLPGPVAVLHSESLLFT